MLLGTGVSMKIKNIILLLSLFYFDLSSTSLVYNMRIRRTFNLAGAIAAFPQAKKSRTIFSVVPILSKYNRHIVDQALSKDLFDKRTIYGSLLNLRYVAKKHYWLEATTGIEHEKLISRGTANFRAARTGLDDIVISGGYNMFPTKMSQFVVYGLAGFPTRTKVDVLEATGALVGSRFYGLGIGTEFSYSLVNNLKSSINLVFQNRFLHFFTRRWDPILPVGSKIQPGNLIDLLFIVQLRRTFNMLEFGYNPTFFTNQAIILKTGKIEDNNFLRHGLYVNLTHICKRVLQKKMPIVLSTGFSISRAEKFNARVFSCWFNFSTVF